MATGSASASVDAASPAWMDPRRFRASALGADAPVLAGVAHRVAGRLGASPLVVRVGFGVLTLAAGWGALVYVVAWFVLRSQPEAERRPVSLRHNLGVVALTAAQMVFVDQRLGGVEPALLWPVGLVAFAIALAEPDAGSGGGRRTSAVGRVLAGAVLMSAGLFSGLAGSQDVAEVVQIGTAALVLVGGLALVLTPWLRRVMADADADRLRRAQAEARADMAAHLHDSVLQTLTLIQNRSDEPDIAAALAHQQERELRRWLYGADPGSTDATPTLRAALGATAAEIEDQYLKIVECIVVGDTAMTEPMHAIVGATREAIVNAAKFAGVPTVSVYAEVDQTEDGAMTVRSYVRDRGVGFDPDAVPPDRHGIADSIHGRIARAGGDSSIHSAPGSGTEVRLRWPT